MKIKDRAELTKWVRSCQQGAPWDARWAYPLRDADPSSLGAANLAAVDEGGIDTAAMSVPCTVNTAALDRYGTVIVPGGCDFEEYRAVPVVLCNHQSWGPQGLPIGKAEGPDGVCTVNVSPEKVTARTYFSQSLEFAVQVFALVKEGIFRGVSVGFDPDFDSIEWVVDEDEGCVVGAIFHRWKLLEYSHVTIPANPECTTRALHRGRIDGRAMLPEIKRALEPFALTRRLWTGGYDASETRSMSQTNPPAAPTPAPVTPPAAPPAVPPTPPATRSVTPAGKRAEDDATTPPPAPAPEATADDDVDQSLLPGAQALVNLHALFMQVVDFVADTVPTLEKPEVIDLLNAAAASAADLASQTADAVGQLYPDVEVEDPDADVMADDETRADDETDDEDEGKDRKKRSLPKPRLRTRKLSKSANATVVETCDFMDEHAEAENLNRSQRAAVRHYSSTLRAVANGDDEDDDGIDEETARMLRPVLERLLKEQQQTRRMIAAASGRRPR